MTKIIFKPVKRLEFSTKPHSQNPTSCKIQLFLKLLFCLNCYYLLKKEARKLCTTFLMEKKGKHNYTPFFAREAVLEAAPNH